MTDISIFVAEDTSFTFHTWILWSCYKCCWNCSM